MKRACFFTLLILCFSGSVSAMTLNFDGTPEYYLYPGAGESVTYDAGTETLTAIYTYAYDGSTNPFIGHLEITASVDNDGNFLGGNAQWSGGDTDLGIAPGTLLYQADITDMFVDYDYVDPFIGIEFAFDTTFVHSDIALGDRTGIRVFVAPPFAGATSSTAFASDFNTGYYTSGEFGNLTHPVPEPMPLALIALGTLLLAPIVKLRAK